MVEVAGLQALSDNYIWMMSCAGKALVIDPGVAAPVLDALDQHGLVLDGILLTHHHADHVEGISDVLARHACPVYGPHHHALPWVTRAVGDGDRIDWAGPSLTVLAVPGHTATHLAYVAAQVQALFCGDTLFAAGCGRIFDSDAASLFASLSRLAALPDDTRVFCAHEYTAANLRFALSVRPDHPATQARAAAVAALRGRGMPTVPSRLEDERATNPFLCCDDPALQARAAALPDLPALPADTPAALATFIRLRAAKDRFR